MRSVRVMYACASASGDPRVPIRKGLVGAAAASSADM